MPSAVLRGGVEAEELVGHVFERFADFGFAGVPAGAAEFVERGLGAFDDAIALDEVHAFEGDVEAGVVEIAEKHEFAAAAVGLDLAQAFELANAVIDVDDVVAGFEFGEVSEEAGGANFAAGAIDGGSGFEEVGVAEEGEPGVGESDAFGEGRPHEEERGGFVGAFGGEACGGVFGFAEDVGRFVFAADVGEAFDFAGAGGGEEDFATVGEARFNFGHAGGDVAVEAGAGAGWEIELGEFADGQGELFEIDLGGFCECERRIVVRSRNNVRRWGRWPGRGARSFRWLGRDVLRRLRGGRRGSSRKTMGRRELSESSKSEAVPASVRGPKKEGFSQAASSSPRAWSGGGTDHSASGSKVGADDWGDRALGARVEFADGFDGVAEEFDADGALGFGGEDVDDAAADGELAGEFDHFGAGVADGTEMEEEIVERSFDVSGEGAGEREVDVGILVAPESGGDGGDG